MKLSLSLCHCAILTPPSATFTSFVPFLSSSHLTKTRCSSISMSSTSSQYNLKFYIDGFIFYITTSVFSSSNFVRQFRTLTDIFTWIREHFNSLPCDLIIHVTSPLLSITAYPFKVLSPILNSRNYSA